MKNRLNKIIAILIIILFILANLSSVYAEETYGSKGYATYSDEEAELQAQEQKKEQENKNNVTEVKSTNNYLSSLQVEGYTLVPEFDPQTLEYKIKENVSSSKINIKAVASNEKAKINGDGEIQIEDDKKEYRIEVTSESNSVRTYIINVNSSEETKENVQNTEQKNEITETTGNTIENQKQETDKNQSNEIQENVAVNNEKIQENKTVKNDSNGNVIIIIVLAVCLVLIVMVILSNIGRGKH